MNCDFCFSTDPRWSYDAADHIVPELPEVVARSGRYQSVGAWLACDECAALIERNEWTKLARRALAAPNAREVASRLGDEFALGLVTKWHKSFRVHRRARVRAVRLGEGAKEEERSDSS